MSNLLNPENIKSICDQLQFAVDELKRRAFAIEETIRILNQDAPEATSITVPQPTPAVKRSPNPYRKQIQGAIGDYIHRLRQSGATTFNSQMLREFVKERVPSATTDSLYSMAAYLQHFLKRGTVVQVTAGRGKGFPALFKLSIEAHD